MRSQTATRLLTLLALIFGSFFVFALAWLQVERYGVYREELPRAIVSTLTPRLIILLFHVGFWGLVVVFALALVLFLKRSYSEDSRAKWWD